MESNLEGLASVLEADLTNYKTKIIRILCDWLVEFDYLAQVMSSTNMYICRQQAVIAELLRGSYFINSWGVQGFLVGFYVYVAGAIKQSDWL